MLFRDREDAGRKLAGLLGRYRDDKPLVLGLPRGGVPVAYEVARSLDAPLDVFVVRKLGAPFQPELGIGAVAEGGVVVLDRRVIALGISEAEIDEIRARETQELERRVRRFRGGRPPPELAGRTVILVDDGIATGGTVRAAIRALRQLGPRRIVLAVAVAPADTVEMLRREVDDLVCVETPQDLQAISLWYEDFRQVSDEEVAAWLARARPAAAAAPAPLPDEEQDTEPPTQSRPEDPRGTEASPS